MLNTFSIYRVSNLYISLYICKTKLCVCMCNQSWLQLNIGKAHDTSIFVSFTQTHTFYRQNMVSFLSFSPSDKSHWRGGVSGCQCVWGGGQSCGSQMWSSVTWFIHMELHWARHWCHQSSALRFGERTEDPEVSYDGRTSDNPPKHGINKHRETASGCTWFVHLSGFLWHWTWAYSLLLLRTSDCPR